MKFNYDVRVEWRANGKTDHKDGIALGGIVAGAATNGASTEKARSVPEMRKVFDAANQARAIIVFIRLDAKPFFPSKRVFDFLAVAIHDATSTKNALILSASCHGLTVDKATQTKLGDGWFQAVTLKLGDEDFKTELP